MDQRWNDLSCEETQRSIAWFLDDELDPEQALEMESHLEGCGACRALLESEGRLRLALRRAASSMTAPARLRRRLNEAMVHERRRSSPWVRRWPAVAAAAILLAFLWKGASPGESDELIEAAAFHARNLPVMMETDDVEKVRQFFTGKLPFAVQLPHLAATTERTANVVPVRFGGRVTQFNNRDTAYVRYQTPRGQLSVFVYESSPGGIMRGGPFYRVGNQKVLVKRVRGFTAMRWQRDGLVYSVVTDLPERDLVRSGLLPEPVRTR